MRTHVHTHAHTHAHAHAHVHTHAHTHMHMHTCACTCQPREWSLFAIYFREVYDWSGTYTGVAQMAGDLLAAFMLMLSANQHVRRWAGLAGTTDGDAATSASAASSAKGSRCCAILQLPLNVAVLLLVHAVLMIMLAQPTFSLALVGQVLMGSSCTQPRCCTRGWAQLAAHDSASATPPHQPRTQMCQAPSRSSNHVLTPVADVFLDQAVAEMLVVYSRGSHALYRRLVSANYLLFCISLISNGYISVFLYEHVGRTAAFYVAASVAFAYALGYGAFYLVRLGGTATGIRGSLAAAERELLDARQGQQLKLSPDRSAPAV